MKLKGKVAFITGFGSGLGQAIAVMFAQEGAAVAGTSPTELKGRETVALVEKVGGRALFWPGDVSNSLRHCVEAGYLTDGIGHHGLAAEFFRRDWQS